ncbi:MAG: histidine kinase dimerization/phospho-acceptor domain-containing protein, partial [Pseudomonadota bacterium]
MFSTIRDRLALLWRMSALRQALGLSLVFLVILAGAGIATLWQVRSELAQRTQALLQSDLAATTESLDEQDPEAAIHLDRDRFVLLEQEANRLFGNQGRSILRKSGFSTREIDIKNGPDQVWRILVADTGAGRIAVGRSLSTEEEVQELIGTAFIWAGLISALVTLGSGLWIGLAAQRRVTRISGVLDQVAAGKLSARIDPNRQGDDLDIVALKIDSTTGVLERSTDQLRHMSGNIAHDLRTPLARLRAGLETALTDQEANKDDALGNALGQTDQIIETFNALLRIARIESGARKSAFKPVDL